MAGFTESLPPPIFISICGSFLAPTDVLRLRLVNRATNKLASSEIVWENHLQMLWKDKVRSNAYQHAKSAIERCHARTCAAEAATNTSASFSVGSATTSSSLLKEYGASIRDAHRQEITMEELCRLDWNFRFKKSAGRDWTSWDPWHNDDLSEDGQTARVFSFFPDGLVMQRDGEHGELHEAFAETTIGRNVLERPEDVVPHRLKMQWRFIDRPLDFEDRPTGAFVRLNVGGREVPTYVVRRSPTGNYGFILESCWGIYTSFTMPRRGASAELEEDWIKSKDQWREAFLYNNGAITLPEDLSEADVEDFDAELGIVLRRRRTARLATT
mmetsp:Transcript_24478/g.37785  ORF Transcript_24478/g.37785 Transcript_24478/m.37785 type:complete len:328 (-) Transcript_24478:349-1332(-)|eukprot:CAMPEP_0196817684 /NCGR_PEP_ID=MMETSP1362-20130617/62153_1 /TAXON_ID=163516 /ORGANISM="Leptocylindrus danicus, Strain CCMP1856" /LENGTH=327 /DNA_ID=CAMNT_0042195493 /DNA_START=98 /DNA_END=1081 /DNA_ORIENTATION=+